MDPLPTHESSSLPAAMVTKERPLPLVWLLPLVVALVALWLVVSTYWNHGTTVTITFESANGVVAGKTKVKYKGVVIGDVEEVRLSPTLSHVVVETLLDKSITPYLKGNTRFWVVQPQLTVSGVSGLNTLVSGVYLEMEPGNEGPPTFAFRGLNVPPLLRVEAAGQEFVLTASGLGSLTSGSPVSYHGIKVGEVLGYRLAEDQQSLRIHLFIRDPYHRLVTASSRFWNASGFSVNVTPAGVNVKSESVQSLLMGGVAFDTPDVGKGENPVAMDTTFPLLAADPNQAEGGGDLAGMGSRLASILQKVDQLPIQEMGKDMQETLHTLNQTVNAPEVMEALRGMNRALRQSERLLQDLDQQVIPVASGIKSLGQSTTVAMEQANKSLTAMERLLVADSPLHRQTLETLRELAATAYALRTLTNTLQRNPESLLFGKEKGKKP